MDNALPIRLASFLGIFTVFALWELVGPRRPLNASKAYRWITNLGIIGIANGLSYLHWLLITPFLPNPRENRTASGDFSST